MNAAAALSRLHQEIEAALEEKEVAIGGSSEAKARALAAFEEHAGEYRRGQQDAERFRRCVPTPGGGASENRTWSLELWRDHFENDVVLAVLPPLPLFLRG